MFSVCYINLFNYYSVIKYDLLGIAEARANGMKPHIFYQTLIVSNILNSQSNISVRIYNYSIQTLGPNSSLSLTDAVSMQALGYIATQTPIRTLQFN